MSSSVNPLRDFIEEEKISKADRLINIGKLDKQFPHLPEIKDDEYVFLKEYLETLELAAIDLWNPEKEDSQKFKSLCNRFIDVARILPLPDDDIEKIKYVLRMVTYSYLGENWEVVRRYLIENHSKLMVDHESSRWNERLFKAIYLAIFYLIRKHSWQDLENAINLIEKLRTEQKEFEKTYLENPDHTTETTVSELASLYHLAKAVELVGGFHLKGKPTEISDLLTYHFDHSIKYAETGNLIELNLILRMLKPTFEKMVENSIWMIANKVNSKVKNFVDLLIKASTPIIEFMYPQRYSILEKGLLDPTHRAIVINLPTSSGKTLIAEFRMLQALNQFSEEKGWVAYVAPTRALVNQITAHLKRDFSRNPLNLKVAKISGALEIDAYEEELIKRVHDFDVLVTTPEKLNLLIRQDIETQVGRPLVLVVVDEVHNIESRDRGINLETLLSITRTDCERANFLLMTPFIPNPDDLARWLDPQNFKSIGLALQFWKPNDVLVGMFYGRSQNQDIFTYFKPLITENETLVVDEIPVGTVGGAHTTMEIRDLNTKYKLTALLASQLHHHDNFKEQERHVQNCRVAL